MKKFIFSFIILFIIKSVNAQYYKTIDTTRTEWDIYYAMMGVSQGGSEKIANTAAPLVLHGKCTAITNTVIGINSYKKLFHATPTATNIGGLIGFIREDTIARKVYFRDVSASTDDLLYDYSLAVGDSIYYGFVSGFPFPSGYYKVKSIQNMNTAGGVRKQFKLKKNSGSDTLRIVEGIGSLIHPLFLYKNFFMWGVLSSGICNISNYDLGLACKIDNTTKVFKSCAFQVATTIGCVFKLDSCNYWSTCGGIHEFSAVKNLQVAPNPANNLITLSLDSELAVKAEIFLTDVSGRIITKNIVLLVPGKNEIQNNVSTIENGIYFIRINGKGIDAIYPLIISH